MRLTEPVIQDMRRAALCWFATLDAEGRPHASPRDAWAPDGDAALLLPDTLSPATAAHLQLRPEATATFLDALGTTGWRIVGPARLLDSGDPGFAEACAQLRAWGAEGRIRRVVRLEVGHVHRLLAPATPARTGAAVPSPHRPADPGSQPGSPRRS